MLADRKRIETMLRTAKGQLQGILNMVEEDRYCMDISNQLLATMAILRKANKEILEAHLQGCVKDAFETGDSDAKIKELVDLLDKMLK